MYKEFCTAEELFNSPPFVTEITQDNSGLSHSTNTYYLLTDVPYYRIMSSTLYKFGKDARLTVVNTQIIYTLGRQMFSNSKLLDGEELDALSRVFKKSLKSGRSSF